MSPRPGGAWKLEIREGERGKGKGGERMWREGERKSWMRNGLRGERDEKEWEGEGIADTIERDVGRERERRKREVEKRGMIGIEYEGMRSVRHGRWLERRGRNEEK